MADTIREQIITAYTARLSDITTLGVEDFYTDIGQSVFRAKKNIEQEDLPACVLWPGTESIEAKYGQNICTMTIKVEGLMEFGDMNPSVVQERILGDLIWSMTNPDKIVSSKVEDVQYKTGGPAEFPNAEDTITAAYIEFEIKYQTLIGNPYSQ